MNTALLKMLMKKDMHVPKCQQSEPERRVAVIGSGPSGLAAADTAEPNEDTV